MHLYFLARGDWEVLIMDENKNNKFLHYIKSGSYFGEVAILKDWYRTATVKSKNYTTWAKLEKVKFDKIIQRFPFIKSSMEKRMKIMYQDRWRRFIKRSLRNIDYLCTGVPDSVVDEISYKMEIIEIQKDDRLFESGIPWKEIFIICNGELEVRITNNINTIGTFLDTLYSGCSIGSYSALAYEDYTITGIAQGSMTVLRLDFSVLEKMRRTSDTLDNKMVEYENYIERNGLPYCDYKLHRTRALDVEPIVKFKNGVKRILRIVKSYKSSAFTELLKKVQEHIQEQRKLKEQNKLKKQLNAKPQNHEEKVEQMLLQLTEQIKELKTKVSNIEAGKGICQKWQWNVEESKTEEKKSNMWMQDDRENTQKVHMKSNAVLHSIFNINKNEVNNTDR